MATSDVLQFRYCIENEVARNATKNFAVMLKEVFEQYEKLWMEYLKLQKYCENADVKIPFQLFDPTSGNNDIVTLSQAAKSCTDVSNEHTNQTSSNYSKVSSSVYKSLSTECTSNNTQTVNETMLADDKFVDYKQILEDELSRSPVLIKQRKLKKNCVTPGPAILDDSDEINGFVPIVRENITIMPNSSVEDLSEISVENNENECSNIFNNNDQIECTPLSKLPKKLGVSKLYNVETTLLENGKKLKQSRLVFLPNSESKETTDEKIHKEFISPMLLDNSGFGTDVEEEIIEDSPTKRKKSKSRLKSLKSKKKSFVNLRKDVRRKDDLFGKLNDNIIASVSQRLTVDTSTRKEELYSISKKTFGISDNESIRSNHDALPAPVSPILADIGPKTETENVDGIRANQAQKRKLSKLVNKTCGYNSSYNDETFCLLGEKLKEKSTAKVDSTENNIDELSENMENVPHDFPPVKKILMNSFDMVPEKEVVFNSNTKNRIERAKMAGTTCWECEKYYGKLGLSEKEIKARQKQCSRHRTNYDKKPSTPEGFWDPLFSDTYSSTVQDD